MDCYGHEEYYFQKLNPNTGEWAPISECPFWFHDPDHDGRTEVVIRWGVTPRRFSLAEEPDYSNSWPKMQGPWMSSDAEDMNDMILRSIRYSVDVDNGNSALRPQHYEFAYQMVGAVPYRFEGMERFEEKRREPKTTRCAPWDLVRPLSDRFPAEVTGFSWMEYEDGALSIGDPRLPTAYDDQRYEGICWIWNRIFIDNTGGPATRWNVRREYRGTPTERRELYWSSVDRRLHLKGAQSGWLSIGAIRNQDPIGEIRQYDRNGDGYFDRWEWYDAESGEPYRAIEVPGAANIDFGDDYDRIREFYNGRGLPEAIELDNRLIDALRSLPQFDPTIPGNLVDALNRRPEARYLSQGERRYVLDQIRECLYRRFRRDAWRRSNAIADGYTIAEVYGDLGKRAHQGKAYEASVKLSECDIAYGEGRYRDVIPLIRNVWSLLSFPSDEIKEVAP